VLEFVDTHIRCYIYIKQCTFQIHIDRWRSERLPVNLNLWSNIDNYRATIITIFPLIIISLYKPIFLQDFCGKGNRTKVVTPYTIFVLYIIQWSARSTSYVGIKRIVGIYLSNLYDGVFIYTEPVAIDLCIIPNH